MHSPVMDEIARYRVGLALACGASDA